MWIGRALTAPEIASLNWNPWQLFQPQSAYWLYKAGTAPPVTSKGAALLMGM